MVGKHLICHFLSVRTVHDSLHLIGQIAKALLVLVESGNSSLLVPDEEPLLGLLCLIDLVHEVAHVYGLPALS